MDTEEFSFPRISDTHAHSIDSPPLWNLSQAASPNSYHGNKGREEEDDFFGAKLMDKPQRKSFSCVENGIRKRLGFDFDDHDGDDEIDDRMDLLWEDFNEEFPSSTTTTVSATSSYSSSTSTEVVEFKSCAPASTVSKAKHGAIFSSRTKPGGMVVIVKVLKKLFSVSNSQRKPIRRVG